MPVTLEPTKQTCADKYRHRQHGDVGDHRRQLTCVVAMINHPNPLQCVTWESSTFPRVPVIAYNWLWILFAESLAPPTRRQI